MLLRCSAICNFQFCVYLFVGVLCRQGFACALSSFFVYFGSMVDAVLFSILTIGLPSLVLPAFL